MNIISPSLLILLSQILLIASTASSALADGSGRHPFQHEVRSSDVTMMENNGMTDTSNFWFAITKRAIMESDNSDVCKTETDAIDLGGGSSLSNTFWFYYSGKEDDNPKKDFSLLYSCTEDWDSCDYTDLADAMIGPCQHQGGVLYTLDLNSTCVDGSFSHKEKNFPICAGPSCIIDDAFIENSDDFQWCYNSDTIYDIQITKEENLLSDECANERGAFTDASGAGRPDFFTYEEATCTSTADDDEYYSEICDFGANATDQLKASCKNEGGIMYKFSDVYSYTSGGYYDKPGDVTWINYPICVGSSCDPKYYFESFVTAYYKFILEGDYMINSTVQYSSNYELISYARDDDKPNVNEICEDSPVGWYDSDGPEYDCNFYSKKNNCQVYGDSYMNFNVTANEACCVCGGGITCKDSPVGWYDSDGPEYGCDFYAKKNNCQVYGDSYMNFGVTANEACCVCSGGTLTDNTSSSPSESPSIASTPSPTTKPTVPIVFPRQGAVGPIECGQTVGGDTMNGQNFYDNISPEYFYSFSLDAANNITFSSCGSAFDTFLRIYSSNGVQLADNDDSSDCGVQVHSVVTKFLETGVYYVMIEGFGSVAGLYNMTMTCGSSPTSSPITSSVSPSIAPSMPPILNQTCEDSPVGWYDSDGLEYDCNFYSNNNNCQLYGDSYMNFNATANEACCVCGGGANTTGNITDHTARQMFETALNYFLPQPEEDKLEWQK